MSSTLKMANKPDGNAPAAARKRRRWRTGVLALLVAAGGANAAHMIATNHAPGCAAYKPVSGHLLIAHAGGALPDRTYPNSIEALDHSYANGFRVFEMDFHQLPFGLMRTGHDSVDVLDPRGAWLSEVLSWMRRHPDARLMLDMKTDNVRGLKLIAAQAPDLRQRLIPFVYSKTQYTAVRSIGLSLPVYALFHGEDPDWLPFANSHAFAAVALGSQWLKRIPHVRHPVIVYTFDVIDDAFGSSAVITNCLVPQRAGAKPA